jgi:hypothetical protein
MFRKPLGDLEGQLRSKPKSRSRGKKVEDAVHCLHLKMKILPVRLYLVSTLLMVMKWMNSMRNLLVVMKRRRKKELIWRMFTLMMMI